jgi:hypothetical protein
LSEFIAGTDLICGWPDGSSGWGVHMDRNLMSIGMTPSTIPVVQDYLLAAPPSSPGQGHRYIIPSGATGAWAGRDTQLAYYSGNSWTYFSPGIGWTAVVFNKGVIRFNGTVWVTDFLDVKSWTPELFGGVTAGTPTYSTQQGISLRTGNTLIVCFDIALTSIGGISGNLRINGIPDWSTVGTANRSIRSACKVSGADASRLKPFFVVFTPTLTYAALVQLRSTSVNLVHTSITDSFRVSGTVTLEAQ